MDQAIFSPVVVAYFFGCMSVLEGKGLGEAGNRISHVRYNSRASLHSRLTGRHLFPLDRHMLQHYCATGTLWLE